MEFTSVQQNGEEYYSFVNGQHTTQGGTHLTAFREAATRTIKEFYAKNFEYTDIRNGMVAAISIKVEEPVFESQTKTKLGIFEILGKNSLIVRVAASLKAVKCVPPCVVCCPFTNE